jgi:hypothetical protein
VRRGQRCLPWGWQQRPSSHAKDWAAGIRGGVEGEELVGVPLAGGL